MVLFSKEHDSLKPKKKKKIRIHGFDSSCTLYKSCNYLKWPFFSTAGIRPTSGFNFSSFAAWPTRWQTAFFLNPCGKKNKKLLCSEVPCCTGTGGCMRTGYVSEWDKNEAPLWFVAWGDQSHPADRPETWQNVLFTLSQVQGTLFVQPFLHFVFASSPSLPCLSSTHLDLLPLSCHPFLLHLPPLLASALPTSLTTVSDSTFPVVHWLSLDRDSQSFCCCHLTTVLWFTLHLSTDLVQHVDLF